MRISIEKTEKLRRTGKSVVCLIPENYADCYALGRLSHLFTDYSAFFIRADESTATFEGLRIDSDKFVEQILKLADK